MLSYTTIDVVILPPAMFDYLIDGSYFYYCLKCYSFKPNAGIAK